MKFKLFSQIFITLFLALVVVSSASAAVTIDAVTGVSQTVNTNAGSFQISYNITSDTDTGAFLGHNITSGSVGTVSFSTGTNPQLEAGVPTRVTATFNFASQSGPIAGNLIVDPNDDSSVSRSFSINLNQPQAAYCNPGINGTDLLDISIDVNNRGSSEDSEDDKWILRDEVEINVDVDNNGDDDLDNLVVKIGLIDSQGRDQSNDLDFFGDNDEESDDFDLDEGDSEEVTFNFRVPVDFDTGNYELVAKVYPKGDEDQICVEDSADNVDVDFEDDKDRYVIVDEIILPSEAVCGERVFGEAIVYNLGDDNQDRVLITLFNTQLDVEEKVEITQRLSEAEEERFTFDFELPNDISNGNYLINFKTEYDYDSGVYERRSDLTTSEVLTVIGCGLSNGGSSGNVNIDAELDSDAMAGEELVIRARITNTGTSAQSFVIDTTGYQSWADLSSVSENIVTLNAGQSREVTIRMNVHEDASGTKSFTIRTLANGSVESQEVDVVIQSRQQFNLPGSTLIWIIAAVNIILIILIILVAVRVSRR